MGKRPRSPSTYCKAGWGPQLEDSHLAKRPRCLEPQDLNLQMAPSLEDLTGAQATHPGISVVVLATGCALKVHLDDVDLVLEPEPTSVLQVSLRGHNLVLIPEALLSSNCLHPGGQGHQPVDVEPGACLDALGENISLQQEFFYAYSRVTAAQEVVIQEVVHQDANHQLPPSWMDQVVGPAAQLHPGALRVPSPHSQGPIPEPWPSAPTPSPERRYSGPYFSLKMRLLESLPSSPLQPLPPSPNPPSPGPQALPRCPKRLHPKARRRLVLN